MRQQQEEELATRMAEMQRVLDKAVRQSEAAGRQAEVAALVEYRMLIEPPNSQTLPTWTTVVRTVTVDFVR